MSTVKSSEAGLGALSPASANYKSNSRRFKRTYLSLTRNALDTTTSKYRFLNDDFILCSFIYPAAWREIFAFGVFPDHVKIDVARLFPISGHLVQVLSEYYQPANVQAVYVSKLPTLAKVRITVELLHQYFAEHCPDFSLEQA